jgi:hypothetical protein
VFLGITPKAPVVAAFEVFGSTTMFHTRTVGMFMIYNTLIYKVSLSVIKQKTEENFRLQSGYAFMTYLRRRKGNKAPNEEPTIIRR